MKQDMIVWSWARLEGLSAPAWHAVLCLRAQVFVVEQACAYQDPDTLDTQAWHLLGQVGGQPAAYLRLVDPGAKYPEPSLGRVLTAPAFRGQGLGQALVAEALRGAARHFSGLGNRISAQAHLQNFYGQFGFETVGEPYDEDGIPHVVMCCPWAAVQAIDPGQGAVRS